LLAGVHQKSKIRSQISEVRGQSQPRIGGLQSPVLSEAERAAILKLNTYSPADESAGAESLKLRSFSISATGGLREKRKNDEAPAFAKPPSLKVTARQGLRLGKRMTKRKWSSLLLLLIFNYSPFTDHYSPFLP